MSARMLISPVVPTDFPVIAALEASAFALEEFSAVAFGPHRFSPAAIAARAESFAQKPKAGEMVRQMKAVAVLPDGSEEIVGFANSAFVTGRTGSDEEKSRLGKKEGWDVGGRQDGDAWGEGANVKFCEEAFVKADESMAQATNGRNYAKLFVLVVSPKHQRQGIGAMLFRDFLSEADRLELQAILGASPEGIGLYRKHGFVDFEVRDFKLWEYEGGEGMGTARHVVMHRPAAARRSE